jgi:hypothetical protein
LPGVPSSLPTKITPETDAKGNKVYSGKAFQDYVNGVYPKYTETDVNRLAVNEKETIEGFDKETNPHGSLTQRRADRDLAVGTAQIDGVYQGVAQIPTDLDDAISGKWDEPETNYSAKYPFNHVMETEGGHIKEYDDTKNYKRIHERHASGSSYEIMDNGTKVTRVKKDNYTLISENDYLHIQGTGRQTTDKGLRVRVNSEGKAGNNYNIEVGNGSNVNIEVNGGNINLTTLGSAGDAGDVNINAARDLNVQVARHMNVNVVRNAIENVGGKKDELVIGNNTKTGSRIDLN